MAEGRHLKGQAEGNIKGIKSMKWTLVFLALAPLFAQASSLDLDGLEGKKVVKAGDIEPVDCPIYGKYDCLSWPTDLYVLDDKICFTANINCYSKCDGFIAEGVSGKFSLYILGGFNGIEEKRMQLIKCPDAY